MGSERTVPVTLAFACVFPLFIGSVQDLLCLCLGILSYLDTKLLCFICFLTIFSLERDSISKQASLQYQSGGLIVLDLYFVYF